MFVVVDSRGARVKPFSGYLEWCCRVSLMHDKFFLCQSHILLTSQSFALPFAMFGKYDCLSTILFMIDVHTKCVANMGGGLGTN